MTIADTWVKFLRCKDESHSVFFAFCNQVQNEKDLKIVKVRSDHGGEFEKKINYFLMRMASLMISLVLELLNKMKL